MPHSNNENLIRLMRPILAKADYEAGLQRIGSVSLSVTKSIGPVDRFPFLFNLASISFRRFEDVLQYRRTVASLSRESTIKNTTRTWGRSAEIN